MNRHLLLFSKLIAPIFLMSLLFFTGVSCAAGETSPASTAANESVHTILAGLSDEQVRQMLIEELQKEAASQSQQVSLDIREGGPGAPLSRLLRRFDSNSIDFEHQFQQLLPWIPNILPDLYKVFISL